MIVCDIKKKLQNYVEWYVHHVRRTTNRAAHALAQNALLVYVVIVDMKDCPSRIQSLIKGSDE